MKVSDAGRAVLTIREGRRLAAYRDTVGVWTIGVGHTGRMAGPPVKPGMRITEAESDALLAGDLGPVETALNRVIKVKATQNQFDALASLIFNVGTGYAKPTMGIIAKLNAGDVAGAGAAFDLFRRPSAIIGRRNGEKTQFLTPDSVDRETIRDMQAKLSALGYDAGFPDGLIGIKTRHAVKAFQDDRHLPETGVLDEKTRDLITRVATASPSDPDDPHPDGVLA